MNGVDLVIFDIAGTTVRDDGQVSEAFATALAESGVSVTSHQLHCVRGALKRLAIRTLLPASAGLETLTDKVEPHTHLIPGVAHLYEI